MNELGIHCQKVTGRLLDIIQEWQPVILTWVDPEPEGLTAVRQRSPGTFIVGRKYEQGTWNEADLKARAYAWAGQCAAMGQCDAYMAWNEPFGHQSVDLFPRFDEFMMYFRERMLQYGMEAVGPSMGTGNFTKDGPSISESFPNWMATAKYIDLHEYSWPSMMHGEGYYCNRFPHWLQDIGRDDITIIVTECGMTQAVIYGRPDEGWRSGADGVTDDVYLDSLRWYNSMLVQEPRVLGGGLYNFEGHGWATFEHADWPRLAEVMAIDATPPDPPEPPEEDPMEIKIYDFDSKLRDWDWLRSVFGDVRVHPVEDRFPVRKGEHIYKVCYLRAKRGYAAILINTRDLDGLNVEGETVVFGWPTAEPHGLADNGHNWTVNGVAGLTNETGDVGPGMGPGAYYHPDDPEKPRGPHFCWVYGLPSDYTDGLGMLAATFHDHVDVGYCEVIAGETEPPEPPTPPENGTLEKILVVVGENKALLGEIKQILLEKPPEPPEPPVDEPFHGEYFNNLDLSGMPALVRDDEVIDFSWGLGSPGPGVSSDQFSVRWTGLRTFAAGRYRFCVEVDDGVRLWVAGQLVIDKWVDQAPTQYEAYVSLPAGQHPILMEYYERGGGATCRLWWTPA